MGSDDLLCKYTIVKDVIKKYGTCGVAFSGGVDSSVLLFAAAEALGSDMVVALHGRSCLNDGTSESQDHFYHVIEKTNVRLLIVDLEPLSWPKFVNNGNDRCYHCKKKTYTAFLDWLKNEGKTTLLDGTNVDDLQDQRPGLKVLQEFSVKTPLVEAGLHKEEIRLLAQLLDLPNYAMPSNSCLAMRLKYMPAIDDVNLKAVAAIEKMMEQKGFRGCRVLPYEKGILIELRQQDFHKFAQRHNRLQLQAIGKKYGYTRVLVDIGGRS